MSKSDTFENALLLVRSQKAARVIPAKPEDRLRQVICAKAEKFRVFGVDEARIID